MYILRLCILHEIYNAIVIGKQTRQEERKQMKERKREKKTRKNKKKER